MTTLISGVCHQVCCWDPEVEAWTAEGIEESEWQSTKRTIRVHTIRYGIHVHEIYVCFLHSSAAELKYCVLQSRIYTRRYKSDCRCPIFLEVCVMSISENLQRLNMSRKREQGRTSDDAPEGSYSVIMKIVKMSECV